MTGGRGITTGRTTRSGSRRAILVLVLAAAIAPGAAAQTAGDAEARFSTGIAHLREGRLDLAIEEFKSAVKQDPKNPYFRKGLGLAYAQKGKFGDAIDELRKALELNPYYVDVHNDLGSVLLLDGKREEGKREFLNGFGDPLNPTPEISAYNLGQAYLEEKNYAEAVNWFRTSLARNKSYNLAYLGLAAALEAEGRPKEALAQLENGVEELPEDASLLLALGEGYFKVGRFKEARTQLEAALRRDPGGPVGQRAAAVLKDVPK